MTDHRSYSSYSIAVTAMISHLFIVKRSVGSECIGIWDCWTEKDKPKNPKETKQEQTVNLNSNITQSPESILGLKWFEDQPITP